jgi:hypothetical protein
MDARTLLAFGFSIEEWATKLGLSSEHLKIFDQDTLMAFVKHDPSEKVVFDHFFPTVKFSLPSDQEDIEEPPVLPVARRGRRHRSQVWRQPRRGAVTMNQIHSYTGKPS